MMKFSAERFWESWHPSILAAVFAMAMDRVRFEPTTQERMAAGFLGVFPILCGLVLVSMAIFLTLRDKPVGRGLETSGALREIAGYHRDAFVASMSSVVAAFFLFVWSGVTEWMGMNLTVEMLSLGVCALFTSVRVMRLLMLVLTIGEK